MGMYTGIVDRILDSQRELTEELQQYFPNKDLVLLSASIRDLSSIAERQRLAGETGKLRHADWANSDTVPKYLFTMIFEARAKNSDGVVYPINFRIEVPLADKYRYLGKGLRSYNSLHKVKPYHITKEHSDQIHKFVRRAFKYEHK